MEQIKEVRTVQVDYKCPKCEQGYLRPTGICHPMNPPLYPHKCTNCEYGETFSDKKYPYINYQIIT
jgi:hypothetical protein